MPGLPNERTSGRGQVGAVLALLALVLVAILVPRVSVLRSDWQSDTGGWLLISRLMNQGMKPYSELWDNKLPPIYWLGQAILGTGRPRLAMFLTDAGLTLAGALGIAGILRRCGLAWPPALACAGVSVCASAPFCFVHSNNVYAAGPFSLGLAILCASVGMRRAASVGLSAWLAGVLVGVAGLTSALLVLPAVQGTMIAWAAGPGWRRRMTAATGYALGGVTAVAAMLIAARAQGFLQPMLDEAVFGAAKYASGTNTGGYQSLGKVVWTFRDNVSEGVIGWLAALIGMVCVAFGRPRPAPLARVVGVFAVTWFATQVAMTFISGYQFQHYHYLVGWSAGLVVGLGLISLNLQQPHRNAILAGALAVVIGLTVVTTPRLLSACMKLARPPAISTSTRVADMIRATVPADQTVLLADGYLDAMGAMVMIPNRPGNRHVLAPMYEFVPVDKARRGFFAKLGQEMLRDFDQSPPDWLVRKVGHDDLLTPKVQRLYDEVQDNGEYLLYRRKPGPQPGPTGDPVDRARTLHERPQR